uniref:2-oxoglutarate-dependent dioxygenase n=1 Tax=Solanum tuberosum TaxID=4113 RepID=M1CG18_SOLTU
MGNIDESFFQETEHRPKQSTIEAESIPLIDLSPILTSDSLSSSSEITNLVAQIGDACQKWGFFQVINHGVPSMCREKIERASKEFFLLPTEEKRKVSRDEDNPLGFYDTEHTKNVRDWKEVFDFVVENPTLLPDSHEPHDMELMELKNQWPNFPANFRCPIFPFSIF